MIFGELKAGWSLLKELFNFFKKNRTKPKEPISTRFVRLFETHGVNRNQIPGFFGFGLTVADVSTDEILLNRLTEEMLNSASEIFAVRREWLDGAESQVYNCYDFYKHPEDCVAFVEELISKNPDNHLHGRVIVQKEKDIRADALIVIEETIGHIGAKAICRYHICNNLPFTYWRSRAYLAACVAVLWKHKCYVHGVFLPGEIINKLGHGEELLGWNGEGVYSLHGLNWHPEDMADRPDVFIEHIDPERDNFGLKSAFQLWLDLESEGYMDIGLGKAPRSSFEKALSEVE